MNPATRNRSTASALLMRGFNALHALSQRRWFRLGIQVAVVSLSLLYLWSNFQGARNLFSHAEIDLLLLALAWILTIVAVLLGALGWRFTLFGLKLDAPWKKTLHIHLASNLAKYVPGFAWQLVGKAFLARQAGYPALETGLAMTIELVLLVALGSILAVVCLPASLLESWQAGGLITAYLGAIKVLVAAGIAAITLLLGRRFFDSPRLRNRVHLSVPHLLAAGGILLAGWIAFGFAFWLMGTAISPISWETIPSFIFVLTASVLIGLAIVFIPGSFGVREGLMVFFLTGIGMLPALAVVAAVLSRILVILGELAGYFVFQIISRFRSPDEKEI